MDADWYARVAASGLTEGDEYGLSAPWKKAFEGIVRSKADASQCEMIVAAALGESPVAAAAEKRCGSVEALKRSIKTGKAPPIPTVTGACKIDGVQPSDEVTPFAVIAAALIEDELAAQPVTTDEERGFARRIRALCTMAE